MSNRIRNIVIVGVFIVAMSLIVWLASSSARSTSDLSVSLRRRSPVTDYMTAEFAHNDCRKNLEDKFLAHVAAAITIDPADSAARERAAAAIGDDGASLQKVEQLCPTPAAPVFNDNGDLVGYTTTTISGG